MLLSGDFDYIQAKAHGLRSKVYELERLDELCGLRAVAQLWRRLYPEADAADHQALERRLLADQVAALEALFAQVPRNLAELAAWMMRRYQVENLKVLVRGWKAREPAERVTPFLAPLRGELALDAAAFLRAADMASWVLLVPDGALRAAALAAAPEHAETGETFFVEAALDAAYYTRLLGLAARLPAAHRRACERLVRREAALYSTLAIFRLKLNYALPSERVRPFLAKGALPPAAAEPLFDYPDFHDMLRHVPQELLSAKDAAGIATIADLERVLWEGLLQEANRRFYRSEGDMGLLVAFCTIKRVELANLIRVIEGVRYGLSPEAIRRGLMRPRAA